jgi:hypothetical protein
MAAKAGVTSWAQGFPKSALAELIGSEVVLSGSHLQ